MRLVALLSLALVATGCAVDPEIPSEIPSHDTTPLTPTSRPTFGTIGTLPGYAESDALAISGDGRTVVGRAAKTDGPAQAFAWTAGRGMVGLGFLEDFPSTGARAVSADGSTVVGFASAAGAMTAWRWTARDGMRRFDGGDEITPCLAEGVSADGKVVAGATNCFGGSQAFTWSEGSGLHGLGWMNPKGNPRMSEAKGISADGKVVVGQGSVNGGGRRAFRWTAELGLTELPLLPGATDAIAWAVSPNGACVVGHTMLKSGAGVATLWTRGGVEKLGGPEESGTTIAHAVSNDCSVVVGETPIDGETQAFVWTRARGLRGLGDALADTDAKRWTLMRANGLSPDGRRVVGTARAADGHLEGFVAGLR